MNSVSFHDILVEIEQHFNQMDQWGDDLFRDWNRVSSAQERAEALIELLEIQTCGSRGGFGKGQRKYKAPENPHKHLSNKLWDRFAFLNEKFDG